VLGGFLTPQTRQALHADLNRQIGVLLGTDDFAKDVLPGLGPDWGLCVTAPAARDKGLMPQALLALRVDSTRTKKPLDRKLLDMLDSLTRLFVFAHNRQHPDQAMTPKTIDVDKQEVHYLARERCLPSGVQPAYGLLNGYLVSSSSLDSIGRFAQTPSAPDPGSDAATPLVRVSVKDWRTYLKESRGPLVRFLADKNRLSSDAAAQQLRDAVGARDRHDFDFDAKIFGEKTRYIRVVSFGFALLPDGALLLTPLAAPPAGTRAGLKICHVNGTLGLVAPALTFTRERWQYQVW